MTTVTGTYDISTLLAARFMSAAAFGMSTIRQILDNDIAAHNAIVNLILSEMADMTTDRQRIYGTSTAGDMTEVDEYGRAPTQLNKPGSTVAFPLRLYQFPIGWTRKWLETKTPADLATAVQSAEKAHLRAIQTEVKKALLLSANYTFIDFLDDKVSLAVKRLLNADSEPIADGPNGETFTASSHTHYLARVSTLAASDLTGLINHVVEHGHGGAVKVAISRTDEATVRALTGFTAYIDPRLVAGAATTNQPGARLDIGRVDNRAIGIFGAAEVWVKSWMPANYFFCWDSAAPGKPLGFRQRNATTLQGLRIAADLDDYPLQAQYMEAEFGLGVWTRTNGAVLYIGDTTWADPTI